MRELQTRINAGQQTESEAMAALQKENKMLRAQLVEVHSKMSRLLTSMQMLTGSVSKILDDSPASDSSVEASESDTLPIENSRSRRSESFFLPAIEDQLNQQLMPLSQSEGAQDQHTQLIHQVLGS